ncbi:MAG: amidase [Thermoprotei archaeon]
MKPSARTFFYDNSEFSLASFLKSAPSRRLEIVKEVYGRAKSLNPVLNSYITITENQEADAEGILGGAPIAIKDVIETAGIKTTAGSLILKRHIPKRDAFCVKLLKQAGAAIVGKTNTHEFAAGATCINPHYGAVRNPFDARRISGGSSGGSAAAVASGAALAALGTDTGGSVRLPAALCGVTGFKPSYGAISTSGVIPLSWSLDHVGIIARTASDCETLFNILRKRDPDDQGSYVYAASGRAPPSDLRNVTLGVAVNLVSPCSPNIVRVFEKVLEIAREFGCTINNVHAPSEGVACDVRKVILECEAYSYHSDYLANHAKLYGEDVRQLVSKGANYTAAQYIAAQRLRTELFAEYEQLFEACDCLILPTVRVEAPFISRARAPNVRVRLLANTEEFNLTGQPAITIPAPLSSGLPVGIQLVGSYGSDESVLRAAALLEKALAQVTL